MISERKAKRHLGTNMQARRIVMHSICISTCKSSTYINKSKKM